MSLDNTYPRVISHKTLRVIIGLIALFLPIAVLIISGYDELDSISISYWTDSRDIFVGSLFAVGFFLSAYNGSGKCGKGLEWFLSKVACLAAICIALFPTIDFCNCKDCASQWILRIAEALGFLPHEIHNFSAFVFFLCLFLFMLIFSQRASEKGKAFRSGFYLFISLCMLIGMPLVYFIGKEYGQYKPLFALECFGLVLFSFGWLAAGSYRTVDISSLATNNTKATKFQVVVDPKMQYFPTGIEVKKGERYLFYATGCWKDWFICCGPDGWGPKWNPLAFKNRIKWKQFFMLCACVGKTDKNAFCIGSKYEWEVEENTDELDDCQLYFFPNDWKSKYDNNRFCTKSGPMTVTVVRIDSPV